MNSRVAFDNIRDITNLEGEGGLLEAFLHFARSEEAKITTILTGAAFAVLHGEALEVLS